MTDPTQPALRQLLDAQHGVLSATQACAHGYTRKHVQYLVESGQWQRLLFGVYAVTTGPLSRPMSLRAALLYGGGAAILSHDTAAEEWGFLPIAPDSPTHITVPYGRSAHHQSTTAIRRPTRPHEPVPRTGDTLHPGVVVHRSRAYDHISVPTDPPRTSLADTAIDLAVAQPTARQAYGSVIASVTNGGIQLSRLRSRIAERKPRRFNRAIDDACVAIAGGIQSVLESHYAVDVEQAHGLPDATRQGPVIVDGVTLYEDVTYSLSGMDTVVRLDGHKWHSSRKVRRRDRRRTNAATLAGTDQLVYGWEEVTDDPCAVADEVRTVLERSGWRGTNPCPNCARSVPLVG
ncbi:type IV toxin-antitoxin system AbiEi family antitoxin domain-containing protein [Rhodococcus sp. UNC363MFTsu5.1]|uniref:type IV toxin-antitoxin system AbiEi family antitoxin domain-containing protein n=1 Tax=Rhodococcus sp. UNC363MFTsu5.1 TaxID=1449069 RepID=UPI000486D714|nr:type IV toxin-antitoxin system AbiEi family antitoxin domain-containing protein [Rhodococcus sp. UNC363MFTsu5.1]